MPSRGLPARAGGLNLLPKGSVDKFRDAASRSTTLIVARVWGGLLGHEGVHCLGQAQHGSGEEQAQELQDLHPSGEREVAPPWRKNNKSEWHQQCHGHSTTHVGRAGEGWETPPCLAHHLYPSSHPISTDAVSWEPGREAITSCCLIHTNPFTAHHQALPEQTPEPPGLVGGISPAVPWVVLSQSQVVQPQPAQSHDQAGVGDPLIIPSPTRKSLPGILCFSLRNEALHDPAQYPQLQPQCHSCLSSCPLRPKQAPRNSPFQRSRTLFLVCYSILQRKRSRDCERKLPLQAAKPLMRGSSSLPSHGQPSSHSLVPATGATGTGISAHPGTSPPGQNLPLPLLCCFLTA